jgi:hypothetical protein
MKELCGLFFEEGKKLLAMKNQPVMMRKRTDRLTLLFYHEICHQLSCFVHHH